MTKAVKWELDLGTALAMAKKAGKPVVLDFFNPG